MTRTQTINVRELITKNTHFSKHVCTKQDAINRMIDSFASFTKTGRGQPQTVSYFANEIKPQNPNNILNMAQCIINESTESIAMWLDDPDNTDKLTIIGVNKHGVTGYGINMDVKNKKKPITTTATNMITVVLTKNDSKYGCELTTIYPETREYIIKAFRKTFPEDGQKVMFRETSEPEIRKEIYASPEFQKLHGKTRNRIERRIPENRIDFNDITPLIREADDEYDEIP